MKTHSLLASLAIGAVAIGIVGSSTAMAARPFEGLFGNGGKAREVVATMVRSLLNFRHDTPLSSEQREQVQAILETHKPEIRSQITKSRDARRSMIGAAKANPDSEATRKAADQIGEAARDRALLMAKIGAEIHPLLTPEQQKNLESTRAEIEAAVDQALTLP